MENKNKPAMPFEHVKSRKFGLPEEWVNYGGLTKREMFAMAAMQGITSNPDDRYTYEQVAEHAVKYADALLAKLDETKS